MKPEEIPPIKMPGGNFDPNSDQKKMSHNPIPVDKPTETKTEFIKPLSQDRIRFNKLEATNTQAQEIAQHIRHINQSIKTIDSHLEKMRESLEHIVKIYPPYPPGSSKRIEALRQFSALRKMIDQLAPSDLTSSLAGLDASVDVGADPRSDYPGNIKGSYFGTGQDGLDIPDLSTGASDQQISDTLGKTIAAQATLQVRRQSFVADANRIISGLS